MDQVTGSWIRRLDHESEESIIPPGVKFPHVPDEPGFLETAVLLIPPGMKFPDDAEELLGPTSSGFLLQKQEEQNRLSIKFQNILQ